MADAAASRSTGSPSVRQPPIRPPWRVLVATAAVIVLVLVVRNVVVASAGVLGWAIASIVAAVLLSPLVSLLDRFLPRALAIIVVFLAVAAIGIGARSLYVTQLQEQVDFLAEHAPDIASGIEDRSDRVGEVAREIGLVDRVEELTVRLQDNLGTPSDALVDAARSVPAYVVCFILTISSCSTARGSSPLDSSGSRTTDASAPATFSAVPPVRRRSRSGRRWPARWWSAS